jgi:nitrogen regulatory protein PII
MKLIEVAIFNFPNDAAVLESILSAEKVEYYMNNTSSAMVIPTFDVTLSVSEQDVDRTVKIIKEAGFEQSLITQD